MYFSFFLLLLHTVCLSAGIATCIIRHVSLSCF
jgi:hypothetical protein